MTVTPIQPSLHLTPVTCVDDHREHLAEDEVFLLGRASGYAVALCGHEARIGPACAPVGRRCQQCEIQRRARQNPPNPQRSLAPPPARLRKPSWLARLLRTA